MLATSVSTHGIIQRYIMAKLLCTGKFYKYCAIQQRFVEDSKNAMHSCHIKNSCWFVSYSTIHLRADSPYLVVVSSKVCVIYSLINSFNIIDRNPSPNAIKLKLLVQINENRKLLRENDVYRRAIWPCSLLIRSTSEIRHHNNIFIILAHKRDIFQKPKRSVFCPYFYILRNNTNAFRNSHMLMYLIIK